MEAAVNYEEKLTDHIERIIKLNKLAIDKNRQYQNKMKHWFDWKKVRKTEIIFKLGDIVMYNISSFIKNIKQKNLLLPLNNLLIWRINKTSKLFSLLIIIKNQFGFVIHIIT